MASSVRTWSAAPRRHAILDHTTDLPALPSTRYGQVEGRQSSRAAHVRAEWQAAQSVGIANVFCTDLTSAGRCSCTRAPPSSELPA